MKKRVVVFACAISVIALSLFGSIGCSNSAGSGSASDAGGASSQAVSDTYQELEVVDSGAYVTTSGYVKYAVEITNPNTDWSVQFPVISVVGKDSTGAIVFSDDWTLGTIHPGETSYWASQAGNGNVTADTTIEITVSTSEKKWKHDSESYTNPYTIANISSVPSSYGSGSSFTGQITLNESNDDYTNPIIVVVMRDSAGKIIAGDSTYLNGDLSVGTAKAFETIQGNWPEYASYEIYANPWA